MFWLPLTTSFQETAQLGNGCARSLWMLRFVVHSSLLESRPYHSGANRYVRADTHGRHGAGWFVRHEFCGVIYRLDPYRRNEFEFFSFAGCVSVIPIWKPRIPSVSRHDVFCVSRRLETSICWFSWMPHLFSWTLGNICVFRFCSGQFRMNFANEKNARSFYPN